MKILFYGDSITDASRYRENDISNNSLGAGYVMQIAGNLYRKSAVDYKIINRGISGDRIVDLYARVKKDLWNHNPDIISILIGINDIWHDLAASPNGVDVVRFEKVYRMLIEDTIKVLPNAKFILCEPFVLSGTATDPQFDHFASVAQYAEVVKQIAKDYNLYFLPLQEALNDAANRYGADIILSDGVHPTVQGSVVIADEWQKLFNKIEKEV